jgi:hypothetical protein
MKNFFKPTRNKILILFLFLFLTIFIPKKTTSLYMTPDGVIPYTVTEYGIGFPHFLGTEHSGDTGGIVFNPIILFMNVVVLYIASATISHSIVEIKTQKLN